MLHGGTNHETGKLASNVTTVPEGFEIAATYLISSQRLKSFRARKCLNFTSCAFVAPGTNYYLQA